MDSERQGGEDLRINIDLKEPDYILMSEHEKMREIGEKRLKLIEAAYLGLKSYQYGNQSKDLAEEIANKLEEEIASSQAPRNDINSVDWRAMCLELASLVDLHRRERMMEDKKDAWRLAKEILEIEEAIDSR